MPADTGFHFAQPVWLLLLAVPLLVAIWQRLTVSKRNDLPVDRYADPELLPHLLREHHPGRGQRLRRLLRWSMIWSVLIIAMAEPRWDFTELRLFQPRHDLVVLLDISQSMNAADVAPTRLARARQEVQDLLDKAPAVRVGLIAFASVAQVVAPLTEDHGSITRLLPEVNTTLVSLPGSRLVTALARAEHLLRGRSEEASRQILIISDGDFDESGLPEAVRDLRAKGIYVHALGVGSDEASPVPGPKGGWQRDGNGEIARSALNRDLLRGLAAIGGGVFRTAEYDDDDISAILQRVRASATGAGVERNVPSVRVWEEYYQWPVLLAALLLLPAFRVARALGKGGVGRD
ncbi:MAG: VWA domain-containing protein [Chromatiales bacterium]|nr:VWA domain-containing protein [Chromatiales bacterium]